MIQPARPRIALATAAVAAVAALYGPTLMGLGRQWASSPDASYGLVLAAVAIGIAWRRREVFVDRMVPDASPIGGASLVVAALLLYLIGLLGGDVFVTRLSFVALLAGAVWFLAGPRSAQTTTAPLVFLLLAMPLPALLVNTVTLPLQLAASRAAEWLIVAAGVPVFRDGNLLELPRATLEVAEACSGLRSIVSLGAIAVVLVWAGDRGAGRRAALMASTLPIAMLVNSLRIAFTAIAVDRWSERFASGRWHEATGWIAFVVAVGLLLLVQRIVFGRATRHAAPLTAVVTAA